MSVPIIEFHQDDDQARIVGFYKGPHAQHFRRGGEAFWVPQGRLVGVCPTTDPEETSVAMSKDFVRVQVEHVDGFDCVAWTILEAPDDLWELDWWWRV